MPDDLCDACLGAGRDDAPVAFVIRVTTEVAPAKDENDPKAFKRTEQRAIRLCRLCYVNRETMAEDGDDPL